MTPQARQHDPGFVSFARRVGVVAGAALAVVGLSQILFAQVTRDIRTAIVDERRARVTADSLSDRRLDRIIEAMELVAVVVADQADPIENARAKAQLRRMRRLAP